MKKRILSIVTALALILALLPAAVVPASAAGSNRTVQVNDSVTFNNAIADLRDGDTIQLTGSFVVTTPTSSNDSLFIGKNVTIDGQGNWLSLRYAGVLLGADVTFKDVTLGLASNVRPALMANGHTLTLENVQRDPTNRNINLFCGGLTGGNQGGLSQGDHGHIIIKGNTNLGPTGRIFAGSISTDGKDNVFDKPATVTIDPSVTGDAIGELYACGALETYTSENDWFNYLNEINPPFASPGNFQVSGEVTFNLYQSKVGKVDGDTGVENNLAQVNYNGSAYLNDNLLLSNIGGLTVESGNLVPAAGSSFFGNDTPLSVAAGATLGLQNLDNEVYVGDLTGGGSLVLGQLQKLTVSGAVSGTTTVGIGDIFNGHSLDVPAEGHIYIDAPGSNKDSFTLAAPANRPDIKLVRDSNGAWTAEVDERVIIVNDFKLDSAVVTLPESPSGDEELPSLPFSGVDASGSSSSFILSNIDLIISADGQEAIMVDDGFNGSVLSTGTLWLYAGDNGDGTGEALSVYGLHYGPVPAGAYVISVTVPAGNSGTGQDITRTATLTVKEAGGGPTAIPVPTANKVLVYNGQEQVGVPIGGAYELESGTASATDAGNYTVKVKPADGFAWSNNSINPKDPVDIEWSIARADNPNPLPGLNAVAPSTYNGTDGKITGTTADMEYADNDSFSGANPCGQGETAGLAAGDYYVRYKRDTNYKAGPAVLVTVPQGPITVQTVAISSTGHKKDYLTGEALDVTGLTLTVTMSNGSTYPVPVTTGMVSGFDSSSAVQDQTLTVTYGGQTATYNISIVADPNPVMSIVITSTDHKTRYTVRELLDVTGLKLTVTRQDDTAEEIDVLPNMVTGFNSGSPMESQTLTVTYGGKTTSYTISIAENPGTDPGPTDPDPADPIAVTGVTLNKSAVTLTVGSSEQLTATVSPDNAANKNVTWASQNTAAATVDANGTVTAVSAGTAVITVTTEDGGKTDSCTVTVSSNGGGGSSGSDSSSSDSSNSGSGTSSNTTTNTTTNADGSVITTVTDKRTGTVTTTTKNTDGSTTVVEAKKDGTVTITDTAKNGVKVQAVSKPETDTTARVTVPTSVKTAAVIVPVVVTPGMVAVDAKTGEVVKLSVPTEDGMAVKLDGSAELILVDRSKPFTDTDGHWAKDEIDFATAHAMFDGTSATTFSPNDAMTRGMIAVVLHNFEDDPEFTTQNSFSDVDPGAWYADGVNWMIYMGITGGYGDGSFGTNDVVSREQLVTFLYRYASSMGYSTAEDADLSSFADGDSVSGYAAEAMRWAVGSGLIVGSDGGALDPRGSATRAQVAAILKRFVVNLTR